MDPGLTLEKAVKTVRQNAAVREQQCQLKQQEGSKGNPSRSKRSGLVDLSLVEEEPPETGISHSSWPEKRALDMSITPYWKVRCSITLQGGLYISTTNASLSHVSCNEKHSIEFTRATRVSNAVGCILRLQCGGQVSQTRLLLSLKIVQHV